jgi:predicted ATPase/DNA-binding winged helix-turn-helix (wHTH) protein
MATSDIVYFFPFRFKGQSGRLWCEDEERTLRPKSAAALHYLVARAGQVVSKDELLAAVWPEVIVSEAVLTVSINELRQALEDNPRQPRFIATVHRRGYRFIAPLRSAPPVASAQLQAPSIPPLQVSSLQPPASIVVGREAELAQLQQWWELARSGQRQVVFIAGEPGIGKTTLVDRFLASITDEHEHAHAFWIGRGQCIEQYGEGEAYLPVLEALGELCRGPEGRQVQEVLHRYAPTWLLQMPGLVETAELSALQVRTAGATRERMLREMAEALEALTVARGLVLVCEDVHVSDRSTLDLIAYLARRRGPAHLLILGTYRQAEVIVRAHALQAIVQELRGHQQCHSLALELLSERAVGEYLTVRFAPQPVPAAFSAQVYERTEGNALFVVTLVDYLLQRGLLRQEQGEWQWPGALHGMGVPESVRQLIERQVEHLAEEEQRVLEVASVGGVEFSAAAVSAGLEIELLCGEERCEAIARRTLLLQPSGMEEWPDGTGASRYRFRHAVHQEVVYARIPEVRRARLHKAIGERIEEGYGERAGEVAAELALHFTSGRDFHRAVSHLQTAADNALRRHAFAEAIGLLRRALELLQAWPDTPARAQQELALQVALGTPLLLTKGQASPEVERTYNRARELCQ